jgi:hypothetical protein
MEQLRAKAEINESTGSDQNSSSASVSEISRQRLSAGK